MLLLPPLYTMTSGCWPSSEARCLKAFSMSLGLPVQHHAGQPLRACSLQQVERRGVLRSQGTAMACPPASVMADLTGCRDS